MKANMGKHTNKVKVVEQEKELAKQKEGVITISSNYSN